MTNTEILESIREKLIDALSMLEEINDHRANLNYEQIHADISDGIDDVSDALDKATLTTWEE